MPELDVIDRKILGLLQTDSRMTMQQLADKVGLADSELHLSFTAPLSFLITVKMNTGYIPYS